VRSRPLSQLPQLALVDVAVVLGSVAIAGFLAGPWVALGTLAIWLLIESFATGASE